METEDLKTDRNSASDTSADTERIRNSQISGQQELNADDTDRNSLKKRQFFYKKGSMTGSEIFFSRFVQNCKISAGHSGRLRRMCPGGRRL